MTHGMGFPQRAGKTGGDARLIGLGKKLVGCTKGVFDAHSRNYKIHLRAAHLRAKNGSFDDLHGLKIPQFSPRGEFGFDRECDQDAHLLLQE
jgi:hypothetical protein